MTVLQRLPRKLSHLPQKMLAPLPKSLVHHSSSSGDTMMPTATRQSRADSRIGKIVRFPGGYFKKPMDSSRQVLVELNHQAVIIADEKEAKKFIKIRGRLFAREYHNHLFAGRNDSDKYDAHAKQIILINKNTGKILSGARVILSGKAEDFYTNQEYILDDLMALPGRKLEVSRVCVHQKYRNGTTIVLLWRGILAYALKHKAEYVFGMPSIQTMSKVNTDKLFEYFQAHGYTGPELAKPRPEYRNFPTYDPSFQHRPPHELITPLMKIFLKAGAKVCSTGNVDHDLRCIDFMTLLKISEMNQRYQKYTRPISR